MSSTVGLYDPSSAHNADPEAPPKDIPTCPPAVWTALIWALILARAALLAGETGFFNGTVPNHAGVSFPATVVSS